jgi:hypothetical protein
MIPRIIAISVMLASAPAHAQSASDAGAAHPLRVMLSALRHPELESRQLQARVRFYLESSKGLAFVPDRDVINTSIADHPDSVTTLEDLREVAFLVRAAVFVDVSAEADPAGLVCTALVGPPRRRPLQVDTLRTSGAQPLDSLAKALAAQIAPRLERYARP